MCDELLADRLRTTMLELRQKSTTHPVLSGIWRRALQRRAERVQSDNECARAALVGMADTPDVTPSQVAALYLATMHARATNMV